MPKQTKGTAAAPTEQLTGYDWSQAPVTGLEGTRQEDLGIPFLAILQKGSPQVDTSHKDYATKGIKDAKPGDIINSVTNKIVYTQGRDPLPYIPCFHQRMYVEWKPRNQGGGLVKVHNTPQILQECTRDEATGRDVLRNGNVIMTTSYFSGITLTEEPFPSIIGMTSTQLKKAKNWLNQITSIRLEGPNGKYMPPAFSHVYLLETVPENNDEGSWFGWKISMRGQLQDPNLITKAIACAKESAAGQRAALPPPEEEPAKPPFA